MRSEDGSIIYECLSGDTEAFGILVDKYKASIYAYVYSKIRSFQDAEDLTQEVFLQAYRNLRSLRHWESFAFWLHRIARNHCNKWLRARLRRPDDTFMEDQDRNVLEKPSLDAYREHQTRNSLHESLQEALDSLSETYREVLTLYYFGGMTVMDMARAIGVSPTAIRKRMSRARAQLKEEMIAMMDTVFEGQRLQASFTFRIVEAVKRIKVNPMPRAAGLPWGLSLAVGVIITVLSLNPHMSTTSDMAMSAGLPLSAESKMLKAGEIPVDILKASEISAIASKKGDGDGGKPQRGPQNALMLTPHAEGGTWTNRADMPTARFGLATSAVDGKIYAIGGDLNDASLAVVEEYDPATNTWARKADMPTAREGLSTAVVNGNIYAFGGSWPLLSTMEEYNPVTDIWTKKTDMPIPISSMSTSVVRGKIYLIGGRNWRTRESYSTVYEYDPTTDTYTNKANMPTARAGLSTAVVNGRVYAFEGTDEPTLKYFDVLEVYDPVTDLWISKKGAMPVPNTSFGIGVVSGKIHLIGGISGAWPQAMIFSKVDIYDPIKNTWAKGTPMLTPRCALDTGVVDGKIYVLGGWDLSGKDHSAVEEYTPEGWQSVSPQGKLPTMCGKVKSD